MAHGGSNPLAGEFELGRVCPIAPVWIASFGPSSAGDSSTPA